MKWYLDQEPQGSSQKRAEPRPPAPQGPLFPVSWADSLRGHGMGTGSLPSSFPPTCFLQKAPVPTGAPAGCTPDLISRRVATTHPGCTSQVWITGRAGSSYEEMAERKGPSQLPCTPRMLQAGCPLLWATVLWECPEEGDKWGCLATSAGGGPRGAGSTDPKDKTVWLWFHLQLQTWVMEPDQETKGRVGSLPGPRAASPLRAGPWPPPALCSGLRL